MKVILAHSIREAELEAYDRGIPPKSSNTVLVATDSHTGPGKCRGLMLAREDVIEVAGATTGRYYIECRRTLEPAFVL